MLKQIFAAAAVLVFAGIVTTSPANAADRLTVKDSNSAISFKVEDTGSITAAKGYKWDAVNGYQGFGTSTPIAALHVANNSGTEAPSAARGVLSAQHNDGAHAAIMQFRKSRGTEESPKAVQPGDFLGGFDVQASYEDNNQTFFTNPASFGFLVDGLVGVNSIPTGLYFYSGTSIGGGRKERIRISSSGNVVVANLGANASAPLGTAATAGFLYIPTVAGTVTSCGSTVYKQDGVTASTVGQIYNGHAPVWFDATNNKICACNGTVLKCTAAMN